MRVLIVGGTRFIGPPVVQRLSQQGHAVALLHRGQTAAELPADVQHVYGDRRHLEAVAEQLRRLAPDVVLDMVPETAQDAQTIVGTFRGVAQRIVAISSQDVYRAYDRVRRREPGPPDSAPLTEEAPLRERLFPYRSEHLRVPDDPERWMDEYDKILVERAYMGDAALPGTILRLAAIYGPRDDQHRFWRYLKRMDDGRPTILLEEGYARWRWTHGYVENIAEAIVLAVTLDQATGRIYNVGEPQTPSTVERVRALGHVAGWRGEIVAAPRDRLPADLAPGLDIAQHLVTDSTRIRQELGYVEPVPLEETLRRTIAWERAHAPQEADPRMFDYQAEDAALAGLVPDQ